MNRISCAAGLLAVVVVASGPRARTRLPIPRRRLPRPVAVVACAAVASVVALSARPSLVLVCVIAATAVAARLRRTREARGRRREGEALAAALEVLVGELKVGAPPAAAFATAAAECPGSVGRSLRSVATRAQLGADVAQGIRATAQTSAVAAYWGRLAVFWQLASEHGLPLSVLMRAAHRDIVDRQRFADRMHAALAGARATAMILAALPALGVLLGQLIGADPISFLLGGGLGGALLIGGVTLICAGVVWADRIVDRLAA